jgi:hypothetical protein
MPIPRIPLSSGNSGSAIAAPKISVDSNATKARTRMLDPQVGQ